MTSLIDSFKENIAGKTSIFKGIILAAPLFYSYQLLLGKDGYADGVVLFGITLFILFGFLIETTRQNIQGEASGMIALNPFKIIYSGALGLLALGPIGAILIAIAAPIVSAIKILPAIDMFFQVIIWFLVAAMIITQLLLFSTHRSLKEAYDFKTIYLRCGDVMLALFKYCLGAVLLNGVTFVLFGYVLHAFVGFGVILDAYISIAVIYNISILGHYLAQIQYDAIEFIRKENVII